MDTVFGIASVTKSFTRVAIMQLQEGWKLSVHDPIINYLPEFKTPDEANRTNHDSSSHDTYSWFTTTTNSIAVNERSMENDPKFDESGEAKAEQQESKNPLAQRRKLLRELLASLAKEEYELLGAPGKEFSYSNDSYALWCYYS